MKGHFTGDLVEGETVYPGEHEGAKLGVGVELRGSAGAVGAAILVYTAQSLIRRPGRGLDGQPSSRKASALR